MQNPIVKKGIKGIGANWFLFLDSKKHMAKIQEIKMALHNLEGVSSILWMVIYRTSPNPILCLLKRYNKHSMLKVKHAKEIVSIVGWWILTITISKINKRLVGTSCVLLSIMDRFKHIEL